MSYIEDELDDCITREYAWFDTGFFAGMLVGGGAGWLVWHGTGIDLVVLLAFSGVWHHFKALQKLRSVVDTVEATVKRWAGL